MVIMRKNIFGAYVRIEHFFILFVPIWGFGDSKLFPKLVGKIFEIINIKAYSNRPIFLLWSSLNSSILYVPVDLHIAMTLYGSCFCQKIESIYIPFASRKLESKHWRHIKSICYRFLTPSSFYFSP